MTGGRYVVITTRTREEWLDQARDALARLERAGASDDLVSMRTIDDALAKDRGAVADLLQAFDALGVPIDDELFERAGLTRSLGLGEL